MRRAASNRPKSPTGSTTNREGIARRRSSLRRVAGRNFDGNGSPVVRFIGGLRVGGRCNVWTSGWDADGDREDILGVCGLQRGIEVLELVLVSGDLGFVCFDLFLEQGTIVGEESGLSDRSGLVELVDVALVDFAEVAYHERHSFP